MFGDSEKLQNLKALKRAPQGTLAFRLYLQTIFGITKYLNIACSNSLFPKLQRALKSLEQKEIIEKNTHWAIGDVFFKEWLKRQG